ncbi:MAG: alpha/beta hydrolase [Myxococcales bacterium]|nr:alpha/beta hydrolase [Myxococcales bacterium]
MSWDVLQPPNQLAELDAGTLQYRDTGAGETLVFVHGVMVNGNLWQPAVSHLSQDFRCVVPDWPLGSHGLPFPSNADLSPPALCDLLPAFLDHLQLDQAILVGNDTGGAVCQLAVQRCPERIRSLVLTPSDAYEVFPPREFGFLAVAARSSSLMAALSHAVQWPIVHHSRAGYGLLTKAGFADDFVRSFLSPSREKDIRRDLQKAILGMSNEYTLAASRSFPHFQKPVLIAWPETNPVFPIALARRLAADFPDSELALIPDAYTYLPYDQPKLLADAIRTFVSSRFGGI